MTSGVHDMCGIASMVPQTVPNQVWDVFRCQNKLCMKLPPHGLNLNRVYQSDFTDSPFSCPAKAMLLHVDG